MASKRIIYNDRKFSIEEINKRWAKKKAKYEPINRYAGDPDVVRCESVERYSPPNTIDYSRYR